MPGRQAHGRPLLPSNAQPPRGARVSRSKASAKALDAFTLADESAAPRRQRQLGRTKDQGPEPPRKRSRFGRDDEEADSDGGGEDGALEGRPEKRSRRDDDDEVDSDFGSDSEGHEWRVGHGDDDDDSDIDSDEAFGEGDDERFEGFVFGGSRSQSAPKNREGSVDEEDGESLGEDAIDLADALDQASESDVDGSGSSSGSGSEDEEDGRAEASSDESDDEDATDASKLKALQGLASEFAELKDQDQDGPGTAQQGRRAKISLSDLGLSAVKDRDMKKSLRLMSKEEKATKPGSSRKLDVPLARRQQDRLVRIAASEKANETLDRWTDTVKHNRRAEQLVFPLPQSQADAGRDNSELMPITQKVAGGSELEQSIMAIMQESGLLPGAGAGGQGSKLPREGLAADEDEGGPEGISRVDLKQLWSERRRERELHSREQARAKKIKKIKSKAWHRVHRKGKSRAEIAAAEGGDEPNSDEEIEAQVRKRAIERVGARHRESKWAKMAAKTGRAAWDEEFREGLKDMARKDEELRRRVEGRGGGQGDGDDDDEDSAGESDGSADSETGQRRRLLEELERANLDVEEPPRSALMKMPFMQNAEKALRKANDELVDQISRDLRSDTGSAADEEEEVGEIGRRSYGLPKPHEAASASNGQEDMFDGDESDAEIQPVIEDRAASIVKPSLKVTKISTPSQPTTNASSWLQKDEQVLSKRRKKPKTVKLLEMDLDHDILRAAAQAQSKPKASKSGVRGDGGESPAGSDDDDNDDAAGRSQLPFVLRDSELSRLAFAADDVVAEDFGREKDDIAAEDDEKVVDNTLPGWGSWVGEGVSAREQRRHVGRFLTRVEAVKQKDKRRDARLDRVIISERRARRSERYLAGGLPFPFETREQYERSLRVPVGPEWMTKESFQDATKPRVIVKQGIIAPMAKPMI